MLRRLSAIAFSLLVLAGLIGFFGYSWIFHPNTHLETDYELLLSKNATYDDLISQLTRDSVLENRRSFQLTAYLMRFGPGQFKPGRYIIHPGSSNRQIIAKLRIRDRDPVLVTISTARTMDDVYAVVSSQIETDSVSLAQAFADPEFLNALNLTPETLISLIVPNSYEVYWSIAPEDFAQRMKKEHDRFWSTKDRQTKCAALGMSTLQCVILASIVEKECNIEREKPTIAGVYLNRINQNIPLQADPTVVFAVGDFTIRRVLNRHLAYDSPYNTYMYPGLPPGPICMPSVSSIDAVLNAESHDYLFFCAKPGFGSEHVFAKTNREHERNAAAYHRWLNSQNIKS